MECKKCNTNMHGGLCPQCRTIMDTKTYKDSMNKDLLEKMADLAHKQWSGWMVYLFDKSVSNPDGTVTIPFELAGRWKRQLETPYKDLSEPEQESDRVEARKFIQIFSNHWGDQG